MLSIYYKIWVDCILRVRSKKKNRDTWKEKSMIMMSIAMTCNFMLLMAILERNILGCYFYKLSISSLSNKENNVLSILILHLLPILIVNYLLIFRSGRCRKLIRKYPYYNGRLFVTYFLISLFLPICLLFIYLVCSG